MNTILTSEQLEILRRLDACTLANAIETFHERLRNEGFVDSSVHCLFPQLAADGGLRRHGQDSRFRAADGRQPLSRPHRLVGLHSFPARAARGGGAGRGHQGRSRFVAGRGACQHSARARLRGRGDQWRGARSSGGGEAGFSPFCRRAFPSRTPTFISWNLAGRSKSAA